MKHKEKKFGSPQRVLLIQHESVLEQLGLLQCQGLPCRSESMAQLSSAIPACCLRLSMHIPAEQKHPKAYWWFILRLQISTCSKHFHPYSPC